MKSKYKVGDKVIVRDLRKIKSEGPGIVTQMYPFIGKVHTIEFDFGDTRYQLYNSGLVYLEKWLKPATWQEIFKVKGTG